RAGRRRGRRPRCGCGRDRRRCSRNAAWPSGAEGSTRAGVRSGIAGRVVLSWRGSDPGAPMHPRNLLIWPALLGLAVAGCLDPAAGGEPASATATVTATVTATTGPTTSEPTTTAPTTGSTATTGGATTGDTTGDTTGAPPAEPPDL